MPGIAFIDRNSTRLNSSHVATSYAVFCLKKKTNPLRANAFARNLDHSLTSDRRLPIGQVARLEGEFRSFDPDKLESQIVPTTVAVHQGAEVLRPGAPGFQQAWNDPAHWEQILLPKQPDTRRALDSFLGESAPTTTGPKAATPTTTHHAGTPTTTTQPTTQASSKLPFWDPRPC